MTTDRADGPRSDFARDLVHDRRGAIMISAVFMSAFLCGALWYIIGIGDAVVYRQYMQDGSDAVAFGAAVYHARGMNIIALINLVMAAVLAVLVAFKIAQVLLAIANVAACLAGAFFDPFCDILSAAEAPFAEAVNEVQDAVNEILTALHASEVAVATVMPFVAEAKAVIVSQDYTPTVHGGLMVSSALANVTLPVENDDFAVLCKHAGEDVGEIVFLPFSFVPGLSTIGSAVGSYAGGAVGALTSSFPGYFCGGGPMVDIGGMTTGGEKVDPKTECAARQKQWAAAKAAGEDVAPFNEATCEKGVTDSMGKMSPSAMSSDDSSDKTSQRVKSDAQNGDDNFAIWSFTWGDLKSQSGADKGVNIAGWNKATVADPGVWGKIHFARAEFYYEPRAAGPTDWDSIAPEAMWNMRWRARMRRFHFPGGDLAGAIAALVTEGDAASTISGWISDPSSAVSGIAGLLTAPTVVH